jgi:hypothetical protein
MLGTQSVVTKEEAQAALLVSHAIKRKDQGSAVLATARVCERKGGVE